jgi:hypothetical protein
MKKSIILLLVSSVLLTANMYASGLLNAGEIRGIVKDSATGQTIPGATVSYYESGQLRGTVTGSNGDYKIKPLDPGSYDLTFSFTGYQKILKKSIIVTSGEITYQDVILNNDTTLPEIVIEKYGEPLIRKDYRDGTFKILPGDIKHSVYREAKEMAAMAPGVYQKEEGGSLNIRGARSDATQYYVDGIRMIGGFSIPRGAIQEITVISGGVPAMFGDATGGIVLIITKSAFQ